jgi:5-methylcytosine-specific restriction endonuclease McrA
MKCKYCNVEFTPSKFDDGRNVFCSTGHQYKYWVHHNKEQARKIRIKSKTKHRNKRLIYGRRYYAEHKEEMRVKLLAWRRKNKARVVQQVLTRKYRVMGLQGTHTLEQWEKLKEKFGQRCAKCKQQRPLTRDHIIPVSKNGSNDISNIQPLCGPCNSSKSNHLEEQ